MLTKGSEIMRADDQSALWLDTRSLSKADVVFDDCTKIHNHQCTMIPLLTRSCLKSNKLRPILNGQFCHAISKNIGLNLLGSKQPREILVFVILKL